MTYEHREQGYKMQVLLFAVVIVTMSICWLIMKVVDNPLVKTLAALGVIGLPFLWVWLYATYIGFPGQ